MTSPLDEDQAFLREEGLATESDPEGVKPPRSSSARRVAGIVGVTLLIGTMIAIGFARAGSMKANVSAVEDGTILEATFAGFDSAASTEVDTQCTQGANQTFDEIPIIEPAVRIALDKAWKLAKAARADCGLTAFVSSPESFLHEFNSNSTDKHTMHAQQKYDAYCGSETYHLSFHIKSPPGPPTSFWIEVNRNLKTQAWKLLDSDPPVCEISTGSAAAEQVGDPKGRLVNTMAKYAAGELFQQMRKKGCLDEKWSTSEMKVLRATTQILAGMKLVLDLQFQYGAETQHAYGLQVLRVCGKTISGVCYSQLSLPVADACQVFAQPRRLTPVNTGHKPLDATDVWADQREHFFGDRQLSGARDPLMERYIQEGSVPASWDPRDDECFKKIAVYNQGQCGSCYANAVAQMLGLRLCLFEKKRRLASLNVSAAHDVRSVASETTAVDKVTAEPRELSSSCLQTKYHWGAQYTCAASVGYGYCKSGNSWLSHMRECCPNECSPDNCIAQSWGSKWNCATSAAKYCTNTQYKPTLQDCGCSCNAGSSLTCLQQHWGAGYTCGNSEHYCTTGSQANQQVMHQCCPGTCTVTKTTCSCNDHGVKNGANVGKYCYYKTTPCLMKNGEIATADWGKCGQEVSCPAPCEDSPNWSAFGQGQYPCSFFAGKCTHYTDYGQLTHCRKTCEMCPAQVTESQQSANPWYDAWYQYMPSTGQMAPCAHDSSGSTSGCDGGNCQNVWNQWMRTLTVPLMRMGESCKPYNYKCWSSGGVVNPLSGGQCSKYTAYQLWHKPCNCIPKASRPTSYHCPNYAPSNDCGVAVPPAMFMVKIMPSLSNEQAVLNMQRHIKEFGPIYVAFSTTSGFMNHDWKNSPVYTGGGKKDGGHAVIIVGWGKLGSTDYWLIRNSWSSSWADSGYCKFGRGWNLDGIESSEVGATMPTSNFHDWSPPSCSVTSWAWSVSYSGSKLLSMKTTLYMKCSKTATLKIFVSNRLTNHKQVEIGVSGNYYHVANAVGGQQASIQFEATSKGFGLQTGDAWVQIEAHDNAGNSAKSSEFITLKKIAGMSSIR